MTVTDPIIRLRGISRSFTSGTGEFVGILQDVSLDIERGSFTVIRGRSGSGKTTLLRILGMLDTEFDGQYLFEDKSVGDQPDWYLDELRSGNIGFIFQEGRLFEHFTLGRNVEIPLELQGTRTGSSPEQRLRDLEPTFFFDDERSKNILGQRPASTSGGQRQRASIMRAIANQPTIILADEPTASLHGDLKRQVVDHLKKLSAEGYTVIVVSHDDVFYGVGRQLELQDGVLTEHDSGPPPASNSLPSRLPDPARNIAAGWKPRAPLSMLLRQAYRETIYRPIFLSLILISLIVGVTQVSVFTSLIVGSREYVNQKVSEGSRLNRIQIKPRPNDRDKSDRFPDREQIAAMPNVSNLVPRRTTTSQIVARDGGTISGAVSGLHPDDPEYSLLTFVAGGPFDAAHDRPEVILTVALLGDVVDTTGLSDGTKSYEDFIGEKVVVHINRYNMRRNIVATEAVQLEIRGIILNGEGGRQLYLPIRTLLVFDALIKDRDLAFSLPEGAGAGGPWPDDATIATMTDYAWEDSLHVYATEIREVLPLFTRLSRMAFKPESDIWDFKWALDIQDTAWRIFVPLLILIVVAVSITVAANIFTSAKLRETEFALWRVLGMRRGDLVLTQVMATAGSVAVGALAGMALSGVLIDQTKAMLVQQSMETAAATGEAVQDFDAIFAPVSGFFWPVIGLALLIGILAAIYPSVYTARTDPAKVLSA